MDDKKKLDDLKKEIRSVLITYQKGCSLTEFRREYHKLIGRRLPTRDFGYSADIDFLLSMPDVVTAYESGRDYHLIGVADQSTQHITKMVGKQKSSKYKSTTRPNPFLRLQPIEPPPPRPRSAAFKEIYQVPPRFTPSSSTVIKTKKQLPSEVLLDITALIRKFSLGLRLSDFLSSFQMFYKRDFCFKNYGFSTLKDCLDTIPELSFENKNNEILVHFKGSSKTNERDDKNSNPVRSNPGKLLNSLDSFELPNSVKKPGDSYSSQHNNKELTKSTNKFEPVECQPIKQQDNSNLYKFDNTWNSIPTEVNYSINRFKTSEEPVCNTTNLLMLEPDLPIRSPYGNKSDNENSSPRNSSGPFELVDISGSGVSDNIRYNLEKIRDKYPHGIWATQFPKTYELETKCPFDLHSLGYNDLSAFINDVPEVFVRKLLRGSRKDWLIYPANGFVSDELEDSSTPKSCALLVEMIILSTRKILQGYPEGVRLDEFLHVYSINCNEPLYIADFGFDSIEHFLMSIATRVPLSISQNHGGKIVFLSELEAVTQGAIPAPVTKASIPPPVIRPPVAAREENLNDCIPYNAASPECKYQPLKLPPNFDTSQYFPVFTSTIVNPGFFYIQVQGTDTTDAQTKIYDDMETFYNGKFSHLYKMKLDHIKENAMCAALWPPDRHWYRAEIMAAPVRDTVKVFYVDYGTTDQIPTSMLRYLKEEYSKLQLQALRACLAHLKPPNQERNWRPQSRQRMLELCQDISLMAKIEDQTDGILSLILCDTNGETDVHINDVLMGEGLAESSAKIQELHQQQEPQQLPLFNQVFNPLQLNPFLQMQCMWLSNLSANLPPEQLQQLMQSLTIKNESPAANSFDNLATNSFGNLAINPLGNLLTNSGNFAFNPVNSAAQPSIPAPSLPVVQPQNFQFPPGFKPGSFQVPQGFPSQSRTNKFSAPGTSNQVIGVETNQRDQITPPSDGEVFGEDDDDLFEQFYQKVSSVKKRYVRRIRTSDNYTFHILIIDSEPYVSSGDVSVLIWNKEPELLQKRLLNQGETDIPSRLVLLNDNEQMEDQFRRFHVKGSQTIDNKCSVLVYPLKHAIQILNIFGHPSGKLRTCILNELASFQAHDPKWDELSEVEIPDGEEINRSTDDDKLNKLCLYDLKLMRESIRVKKCKEIKLLEGRDNSADHVGEIEKLDQLYDRVISRINAINEICTMFS